MPGDGEEVVTLVLGPTLLAHRDPALAPTGHPAQALVKALQASRSHLAVTSKRPNAL